MSSYRLEMREFGQLVCRCLLADEPKQAVIISHGFGAGGDDLVPCGVQMVQSAPEQFTETAFIFPEAPLSLDEIGMPFGRAWWMIDMERLFAAADNLEIRREMVQEQPAGMIAARDKLLDAINAIQSEWQIPADKLVLGGFSQGAMLSLETALSLPEPIAGGLLFSGTIINLPAWEQKLAETDRQCFPVLQSHGRMDQILPFELAEQLHQMLQAAGHAIEFIPFDGGHEIPIIALERGVGALPKWLGLPAAG